MLGSVGFMQRVVDLLGVGRRASLMLRAARLLAVMVCGVVALSTVGTVSAFAEVYISHRPEGVASGEEFADNYWGEREYGRFIEYIEPPGYYYETIGLGGGGDGVYEYAEECEHGDIFEHCEGLHTVVKQNTEATLPKGWVKLELRTLETEYRGIRTVLYNRFAWKPEGKESEHFGTDNPGEPDRGGCHMGKPVNCATGNETTTQTDLAVGGRGPALELARTYNSQLAAKQTEHGPFGYGWIGSYGAHIELNAEGSEATVYQDNGSSTTFTRGTECVPPVCIPAGSWSAPSGLVEATLADEGSGYVYTLPNQTKMHFNSEGKLTSEIDRDGNTLTMSYESGHLASVTDGAGRKLTFAYNGEGEVESVKDPMGHTVKYVYEGGNLKSVTQPAESALRWQFKYNSEHELTSETDGRSHTVTMEYNGSRQVISQTDALSRKREWKYGGSESEPETTIIEPNGSETVEHFNAEGEPTKVTRAHGVGGLEATTEYEYNSVGELVKLTDPNKHVTEYGYDSEGDRTSEKNADGDETKWTYDSKHDIETETTPDGETTTIKRNGARRPRSDRTARAGQHNAEDDLQIRWQRRYRKHDQPAGTHVEIRIRLLRGPQGRNRPRRQQADLGIQRRLPGDRDGQPARERRRRRSQSKYTTKIERDAQGRPLKITDPLGHTTKYTYDGDGNVETMTDGNSHTTKYTYDADNELTKTEEPNKTSRKQNTTRWARSTSQTDGNKHVTKYVRNALEEVEEVINPLGQENHSRNTTRRATSSS